MQKDPDAKIVAALEVSKGRRENYFSRIQAIHDDALQITSSNYQDFTTKIKRLDNLEKSFENVQSEIIQLNCQLSDPSKQLEVKNVGISADSLIDAARLRYFQHASAATVSNPPSVPASTSTAPQKTKLKAIQVPEFDGDLDKWDNFRSMYDDLIHHNSDLSYATKFHHLKAALKGEPATLISTLAITDANYLAAYKIITTRYSSPRRIANFYLNRLVKYSSYAPARFNYSHFFTTHSNAINAIKALNIKDVADFILFQLAYSNLDARQRADFDDKIDPSAIPTTAELLEFIQRRTQNADLRTDAPGQASASNTRPPARVYATQRRANSNPARQSSASPVNANSSRSASASAYTTLPARSEKCPVCNAIHHVYQCHVFKAKSPPERRADVIAFRLCFGCLGHHARRDCQSQGRCKICNAAEHHTLLHLDAAPNPNGAAAFPAAPAPRSSFPITAPAPTSVSYNAAPPSTLLPPTTTPSTLSPTAAPYAPAAPAISSSITTPRFSYAVRTPIDFGVKVMMATITAFVYDIFGQMQIIRALADSCSQLTTISAACVARLGYRKSNRLHSVKGIAGVEVILYGDVDITLHSRISKDSISLNAAVTKRLDDRLPVCPLVPPPGLQNSNLPLADPEYSMPSGIDMILGADICASILKAEAPVILGPQVAAVSTIFGFMIMGRHETAEASNTPLSYVMTAPPLDQLLKRFFDIEHASQESDSSDSLSYADHIVEKHFKDTTYRDASGRFVVALPFNNSPRFSGNRDTALRMYRSIEARLSRMPEFAQQYHDFLHVYWQLGHMDVATSASEYIIPHHFVLKPESTTTPFRVVFNASSPSANGISLNQCLYKGPKLQRDITEILCNFRLFPVALCADLSKMYRQILVRPEDRKFQHIFWRPDPNGPIIEFELNTITYGLTPSAYQAQKVICTIADECRPTAPHVAKAADTMYIDDVCTGAFNDDQAFTLYSDMTRIFLQAGFPLTKWASNSRTLLHRLPEDHKDLPVRFDHDEVSLKVLGMVWDPRQDTFRYKVRPFEDTTPTKRSILSYVSRLFDPLGFVAPVVAWCKIFIQTLWKKELSWDEALPADLLKQWRKFLHTFAQLETLAIPRYVPIKDGTFRLIGFADASEKAYAAVIYAHVWYGDRALVRILRAASRNAPLNALSIPRLELCAALLLNDTVDALLHSENIQKDCQEILLFTDSTDVLAWLQAGPSKLKMFVANRVDKIIKSARSWSYVASKDNPADLPSRGANSNVLVTNELWWSGPSFLYQDPASWSRRFVPELPLESLPELKRSPACSYKVEKIDEGVINRFSSLQRLIAVTARIKNSFKQKSLYAVTETPSVDLRHSAIKFIIKQSQDIYFHEEKLRLKQKKPTNYTSLSPFIDNEGLIRVGGRLTNSELPYDQKFPYLISGNSHLAQLICDDAHYTMFHSGYAVCAAYIRQRFYITSLRTKLKKRINRCVRCTRFRTRVTPPMMGDLPTVRVTPAPPFLEVGTDFAGPFTAKETLLRRSRYFKIYLCVFVCMVTKAAHLEPVIGLTTEAFIAALERFASRRGLPRNIYSDCRTNFKGARNQLQEIHEFFRKNKEELFAIAATRSINWIFNPPNAPNFGGLWEATVKSAKSLMYRTIGDNILSVEEYFTLFTRIEAVLNSRPLWKDTSDPNDAFPLTPAHFLIGRPLHSVPEHSYSNNITPKVRWNYIKQLSQQFWHRWRQAYLHTISIRPKWTRNIENIKVGDLVYLKDINCAPLDWPLGRITYVFPGKDNIVRVVEVRTSTGTYRRPVTKVIPLDLHE